MFYSSVVQNKLLEDYFSSEFLLELKTYYKSSILKYMTIESAFRTLTPALQKEGIHFITFKGIVLSQQIYPTPSLRPMQDIDLLVDLESIAKTKELLIQQGCISLFDIESKHTLGQWQHLPPLIYRDIPIEVHQQLFAAEDKLTTLENDFLQQTIPYTLLDTHCSTLSPEHHLFYLIYHLHKHAMQGHIRLIWLLDIRLFYNTFKDSLDFPKFVNLLNDSNEEYRNSFAAALEILDLNIPEVNIQTEKNKTDQLRRLFISRSTHKGQKTIKIQSIEILKYRQGFKNKCWFIIGRLFPTTSYVKEQFNCKTNLLVPFLYLFIYFRYVQKILKVGFAKIFIK